MERHTTQSADIPKWSALFEWLCATLMPPTKQSAEQLKIWSVPLGQVTNR